jgi:hypothetical protein
LTLCSGEIFVFINENVDDIILLAGLFSGNRDEAWAIQVLKLTWTKGRVYIVIKVFLSVGRKNVDI